MENISDSAALGKYIREKRKEQNLTQHQLAAVSGTGVRFIVELEQGKETCHVGKVLHVLEMLGITLSPISRNNDGF